MHCDACAQTITDAINTCEKVKDVSVSFDTQKATFSYHPDDCSIDDIKKGEIFSKDNLWVKRPGTGEILAEEFESILGKKANNDISSGQQLKRKDIQ